MRPFVLALMLAVPGCVSPPPAQSEPPPPAVVLPLAPRPAPLPVPAATDWRDWPVTPGIWTYGRDSRGSRAMYGVAGRDARLVLRCDMGERRMYLSRAGADLMPLTVRTSSASRVLTVQSTGGTLPYVAAALAPSDPILDAVAFSRGRVALEQAGAPPLVVPAWPEVGRVIEDCR